MNYTCILKTIALGTLAMSAPVAVAQGFYADGGYAWMSAELDYDEDLQVDLKLTSIGGHFGYDISPYFGVEGEVLLGVKDDAINVVYEIEEEIEGDEVLSEKLYAATTETTSLAYRGDFKLKSVYGLFAKANLPLTPQYSVFGRVGYVTGDMDVDVSGAETFSETLSGDGPAYGLGAVFNFDEQFYARGDFTRYDIEDAEVDSFMMGVGYRF